MLAAASDACPARAKHQSHRAEGAALRWYATAGPRTCSSCAMRGQGATVCTLSNQFKKLRSLFSFCTNTHGTPETSTRAQCTNTHTPRLQSPAPWRRRARALCLLRYITLITNRTSSLSAQAPSCTLTHALSQSCHCHTHFPKGVSATDKQWKNRASATSWYTRCRWYRGLGCGDHNRATRTK